MKKICWLIGAGLMAEHYSLALTAHKFDFKVFGRGLNSATEFTKNTGIEVDRSKIGIELKNLYEIPFFAIVAVNIVELFSVVKPLIELGVKRILIEKPGAASINELKKLFHISRSKGIDIYIAYNRRFYDHIEILEKMIEEDGGLLSLHFEFTEHIQKIEALNKDPDELSEWMIANSSHVIDLAFFIAGNPLSISAFARGGLDWYKYGDRFVGSGYTNKNVLFTYNSNWRGPGNWSLNFVTINRRFNLSPLESLFFKTHGDKDYIEYKIEKKNNPNIKDGLFNMLEDFFSDKPNNLKSIKDQITSYRIYNLIQEGKN